MRKIDDTGLPAATQNIHHNWWHKSRELIASFESGFVNDTGTKPGAFLQSLESHLDALERRMSERLAWIFGRSRAGATARLGTIGDRTGERQLAYDEFRRRFEVSQEFVYLLRKALMDWATTHVPSPNAEDEKQARRTALARAKTVVQVLAEFLWLVHEKLKKPVYLTHSTLENPVGGAVFLRFTQAKFQISEVSVPNPGEQIGEVTLSARPDQPGIPRSALLLVTKGKDEFFGWTEEPLQYPTASPTNAESVWHAASPDPKGGVTGSSFVPHHYGIDHERRWFFLSYAGFRIFYEDDRAQIAAGYERINSGNAKGVRLTCVNGESFKNWHDSYSHQFHPQLEARDTNDESAPPELQYAMELDHFAYFVSYAVLPYQQEFKQFWLDQEQRWDFDSLVNPSDGTSGSLRQRRLLKYRRERPLDGAISLAFAVPVETLHSNREIHDASLSGGGRAPAAFGFITAILFVPDAGTARRAGRPSGSVEAGTPIDLESVTGNLWKHVSYFQEPVLRLLAQERHQEAHRSIKNLEVAQRDLEIKNMALDSHRRLLEGLKVPFETLASSLGTAIRETYHLQAIYREPIRGLYERAWWVAPLWFDQGTMQQLSAAPGRVERINILHEPTLYSESWQKQLILCGLIADFLGERRSKKDVLQLKRRHTDNAADQRDLAVLARSLLREYLDALWERSSEPSAGLPGNLDSNILGLLLKVITGEREGSTDRKQAIELVVTDPVDALNRCKQHLFTVFKPESNADSGGTTCDSLQLALPEMKVIGDGPVIVGRGCHPFPTKAALIEFLSALASSGPRNGLGGGLKCQFLRSLNTDDERKDAITFLLRDESYFFSRGGEKEVAWVTRLQDDPKSWLAQSVQHSAGDLFKPLRRALELTVDRFKSARVNEQHSLVLCWEGPESSYEFRVEIGRQIQVSSFRTT